jgi:hypothetical protein
MRPPGRREIEVQVVGTGRSQSLVFEGKPIDVRI